MIAILQWTTLAVCSLAAIARIPSALRGENRSLFFVYAFMTVAILLSIEAPYLAVDSVLGGTNLANLLLRFIIFGTGFALGLRIARGFGADAVTVRSVADLGEVRAWVRERQARPLVIDAKIASDGGAWWLAEAFKGH